MSFVSENNGIKYYKSSEGLFSLVDDVYTRISSILSSDMRLYH
jgi:hypothetical protein